MRTSQVTDAGLGAARPPWSMALLAVLIAMVVGGCQLLRVVGTGESAPMSIPPGSITNVSLGIYSGLPDPTWALTEAESAELDRLLESLPSTIGDPPLGGLGYHGFVLAPADVGEADDTLVAYRGTISDLGSGSDTYKVDVDRTVERYLLDTGRPYLSADEIDVVEIDLAAPDR